jgi:hypothetical protein
MPALLNPQSVTAESVPILYAHGGGPTAVYPSNADLVVLTRMNAQYPSPIAASTPRGIRIGGALPGNEQNTSETTVQERKLIQISHGNSTGTGPEGSGTAGFWQNDLQSQAAIKVYSRSGGPVATGSLIAMGSRTRDYFLVRGDNTWEPGQSQTYNPTSPYAPAGTNRMLPEFDSPTSLSALGVTAVSLGTLVANQLVAMKGPSTAFPSASPGLGTTALGNHSAVISRISSGVPSVEYAALGVVSSTPAGNRYLINFTVGSPTSVGSITSPGSTTTYTTSSDYRLKEDVQDLTNGLDLIASLRPRIWKWKDKDEPGIGFVAHEVQQSMPNASALGLVQGSKDDVIRIGHLVDANNVIIGQKNEEGELIPDEVAYNDDPQILSNWANNQWTWVQTGEKGNYQTMDTSFLVGPLVAAVKELKSQVASLEARVHSLESIS